MLQTLKSIWQTDFSEQHPKEYWRFGCFRIGDHPDKCFIIILFVAAISMGTSSTFGLGLIKPSSIPIAYKKGLSVDLKTFAQRKQVFLHHHDCPKIKLPTIARYCPVCLSAKAHPFRMPFHFLIGLKCTSSYLCASLSRECFRVPSFI